MAEICCLIFHGLSKLIVWIDVCWGFKFWKLNVKQNCNNTSDSGTDEICCSIFHCLLKLIVRIDVRWVFKFWKLNVKKTCNHTSEVLWPRFVVWSFMSIRADCQNWCLLGIQIWRLNVKQKCSHLYDSGIAKGNRTFRTPMTFRTPWHLVYLDIWSKDNSYTLTYRPQTIGIPGHIV